MTSIYHPKDFIKQTSKEIGVMSKGHAYLGFILLCSGIELLGRCLDTEEADWSKHKIDGYYFKKGLSQFPEHYQLMKDRLYKELRCGMLHSKLPGGFGLTELANDPEGNLKYEDHLRSDPNLIVWEFIYKDYLDGCQKIIDMDFPSDNKMNKPFLSVGPR